MHALWAVTRRLRMNTQPALSSAALVALRHALRAQRRHQRAGAGLRPVAEQEIGDDQHDHERDTADRGERRPVLGCRHSKVTKKPMAAANMTAVANQPSVLSHGPFTCAPMMALLLPTKT
jgi:hypothetical protein